MSCYYYLICDDCNRACPVASVSYGGSAKAGSIAGDEWLRAFIVAHVGHRLRSTTEHDDLTFECCTMVDDAPTEEERSLFIPRNTDRIQT